MGDGIELLSSAAGDWLIQSPEYSQMTNKEKNKAHKKLLHSTNTANEAYNKVHQKMRQMKLGKCCGQVVK